VISQRDLVSVRFVTTARQTGNFMGAPATKKQLEIRGIFVRRIADGQVVEEFQATDLLWMLTQMGFGSLLGYSIGVGLFHKKAPIPARSSSPHSHPTGSSVHLADRWKRDDHLRAVISLGDRDTAAVGTSKLINHG
jgi:hypothetical protein